MVEVQFLSNFAGYTAGEIVSLDKQVADYYVNMAVARLNVEDCGCGCGKCK